MSYERDSRAAHCRIARVLSADAVDDDAGKYVEREGARQERVDDSSFRPRQRRKVTAVSLWCRREVSHEAIGLITHFVVFVLGIGAIAGIVPLARGRRAGFGLVLMALSMTLLVLEPRWRLGVAGALLYMIGFAAALWLLLGPERRPR